MANAVTLPGERLAGMTADLMLKLKSGSHTLDELDLFLQRKPLFVPTVVGGKVTPIVQAVEALLEDMESVTVVIDTTVDPTKVLKTDNTTIKAFSLWVDDNFAKILAKAKGNVPISVTIKPRRLKKRSNDRNIKDALPLDHEIDPTEFVQLLATELKKVRAGKQSSVLAKDRRRLFYVAGFVVSVYIYLNFGISEWYVVVSKLDDNKCRAEDIVFSCN